MIRRLFTIASAVSLLLCVATVVLWVRSYLVEDVVLWTSNGVDRGFYSVTGKTIFIRRATSVAIEPSFHHFSHPDPSPFLWRRGMLYGPYLGMAFSRTVRPELAVQLPHWLFTMAFTFLPASWLVAYSRRLHGSHGLCHHCGYSLTGNTSGVCPECGTAVAGKVGE